MANETDPLATRLSGTDPQSLMEYITRQRIYDSRFWKEECFGLTASHVLEKASRLQCLGSKGNFMSLTLKLLQLHPEHELVASTFCRQEVFVYVRALGALYIRLTSRPVEIYECLERLYTDYRILRVHDPGGGGKWTTMTMDKWIHQLLVQGRVATTNAVGMTLPRLPARSALVEAGYLPEGLRPTGVDLGGELVLSMSSNKNDDETYDTSTLQLLNRLYHLALEDKVPAAIEAWEKRRARDPLLPDLALHRESQKASTANESTKQKKKKKQKKAKERNYGNLFKPSQSDAPQHNKKQKTTDVEEGGPEVGSEEYWNEQRAKLGLSKLK